jgi:hypothetical protein
MMIKFNRYHVTNGTTKARVSYSLDNRIDGRKCVTLYAKDYSGALAKVLSDVYRDDTDMQTDYFEKGKAVLFENHPLYAVARARAVSNGCYAPAVYKSLDELRAEYR